MSEQAIEKPPGLTDEHLRYLDTLRESGVTNMFSAGPWLRNAFGLDRDKSHAYLGYWMKTFSERHNNGGAA